jgi:hypothetical protein
MTQSSTLKPGRISAIFAAFLLLFSCQPPHESSRYRDRQAVRIT